ncbi:MAG: chemotaxis protein CheW [Candidatus Limnocylindrales bacterium]|nr:chemotaxis protein CheW [Candidatus Limnocylindrales bacterium]
MVDADRTAEVLATRARVLARPLKTAEQEGATIQMLGFEAGGDRFALPVESIVTVMSAVRPTPVPGMPPWLVGAVGVRGRVVAVVSPDRFLGTRPGPVEPAGRSTAVVVADGSAEVALLVDRLDPVESIAATATGPLPAGSSDIVGRASRGIIDGRLVLDPDGLIAAIRSALQPMTGEPSPAPDHRPIGPK